MTKLLTNHKKTHNKNCFVYEQKKERTKNTCVYMEIYAINNAD